MTNQPIKEPNKRPNILLICSDQHRYDCLGINGHPLLRTPNLDRLASGGVNFMHAFTPCPVCTPSRVSMLTGQWSFNHGLLTIPEWTELKMVNWAEHSTSFPSELKKAGYRLTHIGKWHSCAEAHQNERPSPTDIGFDEFIPEYAYYQYCRENGIVSSNTDRIDSKIPFERWGSRIDPHICHEQTRLHWGADQTIAAIERSKKTPFFIRWDPSEPHIPNVVPKDYADRYAPEEITLWPSVADRPMEKTHALRKYVQSWGIQDLTDDEIRHLIHLYLANIELLDHEAGRIFDHLASCDLLDHTLIIYTTDHGDTCGSHRLIDKHFTMYDDITRVPLIMSWPGRLPSGVVREDFVSSSVDLASTILAAADLPIPDSFHGKSLLMDTGRKDMISAYHGAHIGLYTQRMLRDKNWKYVFNATDRDELYDMTNDPWEMKNLIDHPNQKERISRMRSRLAEWMKSEGDRLVTSPWIIRQLDGAT